MAEPFKDPRFSHVSWDPKFSRVPRRERKVKIDERFKSMFTDSKFKSKSTVDKRGKSIKTNTIDDLKRYYDLSSSDEEENSQKIDKNELKVKKNLKKSPNKTIEIEKSKDISSKKSKNKQKIPEKSDSESGIDENSVDSDDSDQEKPKICLDLARGEGNLASSSDADSSEDDWAFEEDPNLPEHRWGELDADAPRTEQVTSRLAVCNMDWDRVKAKDLLVLFNSFKPPLGIIRSVTIYPSKFGKERMKDEEINGPIELRELQKAKNSQSLAKNVEVNEAESDNDQNNEQDQASDSEDYGDEDDEGNDDGSGVNNEDEEENLKILEREKIREYQLNRLKYFYAVVECDSAETANQIYESCDGTEYESSATKLDLRFIPDDLTFDDETPRDQALELGDLDSYKPLHFRNAALQQAGKVELTWDETDPSRKQLIDKIFGSKNDKKRAKGADFLDMDEENLHTILASGSSDDESDQEKTKNLKSLVDSLLLKDEKPTKTDDFFEKDDQKMAENVENSTENSILDVKNEEKSKKNAKKLTPWQQYLEKRRQKRAEKRQEAHRKLEHSRKINNPSENLDDFPEGIDPNDPYFKEEFDQFEEEFGGNRSIKGHPKRTGQSETKALDDIDQSENEEKAVKKRQELELLLSADSATDARLRARNFNLKKLLNEDKSKKSKMAKKRQATSHDNTESRDNQATDDNFQFNVDDPRFQAMYSSHLFNLDPTEPAFKKTKNMQILLDEKIKRIKIDKNDVIPSKINKNDVISAENSSKIDQNSTEMPQKMKVDDEIVDTRTNFDNANINLLVKSIKSKTKTMQMKKDQKKMKVKK